MWVEFVILPLGIFIAAFCAGLAGFAFNLVAAGILFHVLSPQVMAPLLVVGSMLVQSILLPAIWHAIEWRKLLPLLVAGMLGTPVGLLMLGLLDARLLAAGVGATLVLYSGYILARLALRMAPPRLASSTARQGVVGFASGILGGVGGFSGAPIAIWADIQGLPKEQTRALLQPFIVLMQVFAAAGLAYGGFFTAQSGWMMLTVLPALLAGTFLGLRAYRAIPAEGFRLVLLGLLFVSGLSLLI